MRRQQGIVRLRSQATTWSISIASAARKRSSAYILRRAKSLGFRLPDEFEDRYGYNNGPRASPVIDGDSVYTYGAEGKLHRLQTATGK